MKDHESLRTAFADLKPRYERLIEEVEFSIREGLRQANLHATITNRVKTIDSLLGKIERKQYNDPLAEVTDLAGVRVVCQFTRDLEVVKKILERDFSVHEEVDKSALLGADRMGYLAHHFIVQLGAEHKGPRYDGIATLRCEVQVKTILHDAWAQIDHSLMYKAKSSIPERERRELNNVSALLEVAQGIFDRTRETRERYAEEVEGKRATPSEFLAQPIDRETLAAYTRHKYPGLPVNTRIQEVLFEQLNHERYKTLKDLDRVIGAAAEAVDAYRAEAPTLFKAGTDFITKSLGFVDTEFRKRHGFAPVTRQAFVKFAKLVRNGTP